MGTLITKVRIIDPCHDLDLVDDVFIDPHGIKIAPTTIFNANTVLDGRGKILAPGLIDLHVHFREPGFCHKETIASGIRAALAGGVTSALVMPNTSPVIAAPKDVFFQTSRAQKWGFDLMVAAAASRDLQGEIATNIAQLKYAGIKAVTDDGKPILGDGLMEQVLRQCRVHNIVCMQHAEDLHISKNAAMNEGAYSRKFGIAGQPASAEFDLIARDLKLVHRIGARYHVLHVSCAQSLALIRKAKVNGMRVTCEVSPHHLLCTERDIVGSDSCKKMNPPLRSRIDQEALINALADGLIDAVASDHAPHSRKEKRHSFAHAPFGVVGVESAIIVLMTLVKQGHISLKRAIESMSSAPAAVLDVSQRIGSLIGEQHYKNAVLLDPHCERIFSQRDLHGLSVNSSLLGRQLYGRVIATFLHGKQAFLWSPS